MLTEENFNQPYALISKGDNIHFYSGKFFRFDKLDDLEKFYNESDSPLIFITPFSVAKEKGFKVVGDEKILILQAELNQKITVEYLDQFISDKSIELDGEISPSKSNEDFANEVKRIQSEEIAEGNACQVVLSRKFQGRIDDMTPGDPLVLFRRLLLQKGQYMTFLFSDGQGHFFVGASPERQLEIRGGNVVKNPIAGTMPKGERGGFKERLIEFLNDPKETNELSQVLDEELKMMAQICPEGGKIFGPYLRETGAVIHSEYHLVGRSSKPPIQALKESFHAPTLVGSPLESAFRIIAKREQESRRYYGGEFGIMEPNGDIDSAIMIRTAEIDKDGSFVIQAGAGIVRDSLPEKEANETRIKAAGMISALMGDQRFSKSYLDDIDKKAIEPILKKRNQRFSRFHFEDQFDFVEEGKLKGLNITIVNNEDNFAHMLGHIVRHMGCIYKVIDTFDYSPQDDTSDVVILGPGPGNINDEADPRMQKLLTITRQLLDESRPVLGICLGNQALGKSLGMIVEKQKISTQGVQIPINYFGKKEKVGFYNSFIPRYKKTEQQIETSLNEEEQVVAMKGKGMAGLQFHPESAMSQNGYGILKDALFFLAPKKSLPKDQIKQFVKQSVSGAMTLDEQKEFLVDLNEKGYTGTDIANFIKALYKEMSKEVCAKDAIDICGTGGSNLPRINTSTLAAFVCATCGISIAKHGNRAASGRFGSFDLLEALGVNIEANHKRLELLY
ncbi:chorismate-binding protein, partial [Patescibacteria group bacterium]|nr:chorismate-binding protein [Patescibacteria group bacterium]